jgi:predicted phage terminase large subunit-like protein
LGWGGSRSGKTFAFCRGIIIRAMKAPGSRHLIARYRFNHVIQSIWHDTGPKALATCFPEVVERVKQDKAQWFWSFPNGSEIWFGGLDEKERTEKVLGLEFATVFLNEVSQISLAARNLIVTRLAQKVDGLALKCYCDCNPPVSTHWCHRLFLERREATQPYGSLKNAEAYAHIQMNPADNAANLPATYLAELQALPARERMRFWEGRFGDVGENALWTFEGIETYRKTVRPDLRRIIVAVDPSGTKGADQGDTVGIVVVGLGLDGNAYVLEDASVKAPPDVWGRVVVNCYDRHAADCVVAETNFGGAMVEQVVKTAAVAAQMRIPFKEVKASRGKVVRAEPIASLYAQGKIHHVGTFPNLEDQLTAFTTMGYMGEGSPDRADALVWGLTEIFPRIASSSNTTPDHLKQPGTVGTWGTRKGKPVQLSYLPEGGGGSGFWARQRSRGHRGPHR